VDFTLTRQPYEGSPSGVSFLRVALGDPAVKKVVIATAWVRESGLGAIESELKSVRSRGGRVDMVVGVDLKGTTRQGLDLARTCTDSLYVVHDPERRTFHPKLYLAYGGTSGYALIGSHNLTAGGLGFNYESGLACEFNPKSEPSLKQDIEAFVRGLIRDEGVCRELTPAVRRRLQREGWLADEERDRRHRDEDRTRSRSRRSRSASPLFPGSSREKRTDLPPRSTRGGAGGTRLSGRVAGRVARAPDRWSKRLGAGDAVRSPRGHPMGVVRLTPPPDAPDRARYFRQSFFAQEKWRRKVIDGKPTYEATIEADVIIGGRSLGRRRLRVNEAAHRNDPPRGRATTNLYWGDLTDTVRTRNVVGWYVILERGAGAYRLIVTPHAPA
jgi:hypothetical protein